MDIQYIPKYRGRKAFIEARYNLNGYVEATALRFINFKKMVKFLRDIIFYKYGLPRRVLIDRGLENAKMVTKALNILRIPRIQASAYHS